MFEIGDGWLKMVAKFKSSNSEEDKTGKRIHHRIESYSK